MRGLGIGLTQLSLGHKPYSLMWAQIGYWVWVVMQDLGVGFEIKILRVNGIE